MSNLWIFGFQALWSPIFFMFMLSILISYFFIIGPYRTRFEHAEKVSRKQIFYFTSGIILLYIVKGGPIDLIGHIIFSAHMLEMAVMYIAVPPLLLLGIPVWLYSYITSFKAIQVILKLFAKPLIALFVFNGLFSFYHLPLVFDAVKQSQVAHPIVLAILFFTSIMMWWPMLNPLPEQQSLSDIKKLGYMFANGILLTPACALIIFASEPLFATYTDSSAWMKAMELCVPAGTLSDLNITGPEFLHWLPVVQDQQTGGIIMKIVQEIVYGTMIGYVFFKWARKEREKDKEQLQAVPPYLQTK
ncbi:cytochrome c oxidase assembly factor CtaG [Bacillus cytotoxicus]|uniref:Possible CtaG membrane protein n=1 Tax=Bacillus cytotoxicus TaxID=580165 RepID=A0AAX2CJB1_9BACI|nr:MULTISPECIES: cytochrome c oxidase assembly factor CtaG [Bacillus cereus group]AWC33543.1 cytochrome c oxidase assembly factor CtaG [Bacillus cytotoxicus]AWC37520.1 cytochrome c oxidase assembly factor CtaG [Bacillus cytotoxicus]AWC61742.1 cytochrome c oxidase assembly factor CtaG [Bacillus cytotoxicus]KMT51578.1 cytochrome C oxidase assembly protein [Bacillus cytotoxicus]QTR69985.1 cytochrome c oxidase assembly factor CtaG [Bacillus cytotoxicus]